MNTTSTNVEQPESRMNNCSTGQMNALLSTLLAEAAKLCKASSVPLDVALQQFTSAYSSLGGSGAVSEDIVSEEAAAQVLSAWHEREQYLNDKGSPRAISVGTGSEFENLCLSVSPASDAGMVLQTLVSSGAVALAGDSARPLRRRVMLSSGSNASVARVARLTTAYFRTLTGNTSTDQTIPRRFERTVATHCLDPAQLPALTAYLTIHGQAFLEDLDGWMTAREISEGGQAVGVGLYLFTENA